MNNILTLNRRICLSRTCLLASLVLASSLATIGCSDSDSPAADKPSEASTNFEKQTLVDVHNTLLKDVTALHEASLEIQAVAPTPKDRGWDAELDKEALTELKQAWLKARGAYERTEGALAPIFPDIDAMIDARYEDFLEEIGPKGDTNLFDGQGVTGMHAVERIVFAPEMPSVIVEGEQTLPGYKKAAWPSSAEEASAFKDQLCAQLVTDTGTLLDSWTPQKIDLAFAFGGLVALMNEQREKVVKAAGFEEESRYSQRTMADIRDNLEGTRRAYAAFEGWIASKEGGAAINKQVQKGFTSLEKAYTAVSGDSFPAAPKTWSAEQPSAADLETEFGQLYSAVFDAVDPNRKGSAVEGMNQAAVLLGFPEFAEE